MRNHRILISVIIITNGSSKYLLPLVKSLVNNNKRSEFEIILVSNKIIQVEKCKIIFSKTFKGYSHACNLGAKYACGNYLLFLNDDMLSGLNALDIIFKYIERTEPSNILFAPRLINSDGTHQDSIFLSFISSLSVFLTKRTKLTQALNIFLRIFNLKISTWGLTYRRIKTNCEGKHVMGAAMCLSKELFERVGGFDENIFLTLEDQLLCRNVINSGGKVMYIHKSVFIHYGNATIRNITDFDEIFNNSLKYFIKQNTF